MDSVIPNNLPLANNVVRVPFGYRQTSKWNLPRPSPFDFLVG